MTEPSANPPPVVPDDRGLGHMAMSWICVIVALILVGWGLVTMLTYNEADKLVGGDAYNYIILATRGAGLVTAGAAFAGLAVTFAVFALRARR